MFAQRLDQLRNIVVDGILCVPVLISRRLYQANYLKEVKWVFVDGSDVNRMAASSIRPDSTKAL